jgi:hypothetical protein
MVTSRAVVAEGRGRYDEAIEAYGQVTDAWANYGFALEEARTRLGLGRSLIALGREGNARPELERARVLFDDLAAAPFLAEVDGLLGRAAVAPA